MSDRFERTTRCFRVYRTATGSWVEDVAGGQDDGWLMVPDSDLDQLIAALQAARTDDAKD